jgi:hypothetical protein
LNKKEAAAVLERELHRRRTIPYAELRKLVVARHIDVLEIEVQGASYQVEIQYFWDGDKEGPIRVLGGIDDGGWSSLSPISRSFSKGADGSFVGE